MFEETTRLAVFLSRKAPLGVVLRRGPSAWAQLTAWDRKTDHFMGSVFEHIPLTRPANGATMILSPLVAVASWHYVTDYPSVPRYLGVLDWAARYGEAAAELCIDTQSMDA